MSSPILEIPEVRALDGPSGLIRIPNQIDVPVTPRILRLIDTPQFQRLKRISQLGLVSMVYPAANHHRFEHSLGVYRMSLLFLKQLAHDPRFAQTVDQRDGTRLILAALLHDIGHWPYCHPIEDLSLDGIPTHEAVGKELISNESIAECLREDWSLNPEDVAGLISKRFSTPADRLLGSILSGPIDIDKMDYLYRDSLHAGVPYGQNFDQPRLIRSLCLSESGDRLAISHKGKTAAELMVFARYVMFSEVYWHHAVRSATAMFQRAFYRWYGSVSQANPDVNQVFEFSESEFPQALLSRASSRTSHSEETTVLLDRLFGPQRRLHKRVASFSCVDGESVYRLVARAPYPWIVQCSEQLAEMIGTRLNRRIESHQVIIDAPPVGLEVQFNVDVGFPQNKYRKLGDVSPVVKTLARNQFDDIVKQVRVFVDPAIRSDVLALDVNDLVQQAVAQVSG